VDMLVVNEGELATLAGAEGDVMAQLQRLSALHGLQDVIVTLGAEGCVALHQGHFIQQKAYKIEVVDTTAAGDTFCGALVAALSHGAPLQQCLKEASAASALACTKLGAQSSIPDREEVLQFMQNLA
jgi:ribokinase